MKIIQECEQQTVIATATDITTYPRSLLLFERNRNSKHFTHKTVTIFEYDIKYFNTAVDNVRENDWRCKEGRRRLLRNSLCLRQVQQYSHTLIVHFLFYILFWIKLHSLWLVDCVTFLWGVLHVSCWQSDKWSSILYAHLSIMKIFWVGVSFAFNGEADVTGIGGRSENVQNVDKNIVWKKYCIKMRS